MTPVAAALSPAAPAPPGNVPLALRDALRNELLASLARQAQRVPIPVGVAALVIAALAYGHVPGPYPLLWLAGVAAMQIVRPIVLSRLLTWHEIPIARRVRIAVLLSLGNGLLNAASLAFFPYLPGIERAVHSMVLVGLSAGTVATAIGYRPIFLAYTVPTLGALALVWLLAPSPDVALPMRSALALLMVLLGVVLYSLTRDTYSAFQQTFESRAMELSLNAQLSEALARAEAASRAKTRFLASASHDLRQPLHTLSLFAAALTMQPLDRKSADIAQKMNEAMEELSQELDALLDISKLDAGVVRPSFEDVDVPRLLRRLCDTHQPLAQRKGLALKLDCVASASVHADRAMLERIVRNLLDNAIKYTEHGTVTLSAEVCEEGCTIAVTDTGRGIPAAEQGLVFEEFYQIGNPERDRRKGLGLGLSIVQRLASLTGARLSMASAEGEGSRFQLIVPLAQSSAEALVPASARPRLSGLRVLVVDDETGVRLAMRALLEALGCRVTDASDFDSAVDTAKREAPDVVLADWRLGGDRDGIDVIRAVRLIAPGTPALLVSGDTAPARLREAERAGIPLLHKPVPVSTLTAEIARLAAERPGSGGRVAA